MTPGILLLIGVIALVVGAIGAVLNFIFNGRGFLNSRLDVIAGVIKHAAKMMIVHVLCAIVMFLGALSLLGGGIWFIIEAVNKSA